MIPSLSTRIAEPPGHKDRALYSLADFAPMAKELGYAALSMRASQLSVDTPADEVALAKAMLDEIGVRVSLVTGTVSLATNDERAAEPLRHITPHLDLAERLGCALVRVMAQCEDDIPWLRRAADEAGERGMRLAHQLHIGTLCETAEAAMDVLHRVNSPHLGITYEPSNPMVCGGDYGPEVIERLAPHIVNVYLQNWHQHPGGNLALETNAGVVKADQVALDDRRGVDLDRVFEGLRRIGWAGYVTVHQALMPGQDVRDEAARHVAAIRPYVVRSTG